MQVAIDGGAIHYVEIEVAIIDISGGRVIVAIAIAVRSHRKFAINAPGQRNAIVGPSKYIPNVSCLAGGRPNRVVEKRYQALPSISVRNVPLVVSVTGSRESKSESLLCCIGGTFNRKVSITLEHNFAETRIVK